MRRVPAAVAASLLAAALLAAGAPAARAAERAAPELVPFFTATDLGGGEVRLGDLVAAKRVVLFFWDWRRATSTREMAFLGRMLERHGKLGLAVVAVEGEGSSREQVAERVEKLAAIGAAPRYPVVPDPGGRIARQARVEATPHTILVGPGGRVAFRLQGFRAEDEPVLEARIAEFLGIIAPAPAPAVAAPPAGGTPPPVAPTSPAAAASPSAGAPARPAEPTPEEARRQALEKYRYFGQYHLNRGEAAKAEDFLRRYLALDPGSTAIWLLLGEALAAQGAYDRAREAWEAVLRIDPGNAEADANIRRLIRGEY